MTCAADTHRENENRERINSLRPERETESGRASTQLRRRRTVVVLRDSGMLIKMVAVPRLIADGDAAVHA